MKELSLREIQMCEYRIMKLATDWMEENGINYMLTGGTLLGAIRHNGFIPWDDDIDMFMPRPDYERMKKLVRQGKCNLGEGIELLFPGDKYCYRPYAMLVDTRIFMDMSYFTRANLKQYMKVDIFPLDRIPTDAALYMKERLNIERIRQVFWSELREPPKERGFNSVRLRWLRRRAISFLLGGYRNVSRIMDWYGHMIDRANRSSKRWGDIVWVSRTFPRHYINTPNGVLETQKHLFERDIFRIPVEYNQYLSNIYGAYMELPPPEKRVPRHRAKMYWIDRDEDAQKT